MKSLLIPSTISTSSSTPLADSAVGACSAAAFSLEGPAVAFSLNGTAAAFCLEGCPAAGFSLDWWSRPVPLIVGPPADYKKWAETKTRLPYQFVGWSLDYYFMSLGNYSWSRRWNRWLPFGWFRRIATGRTAFGWCRSLGWGSLFTRLTCCVRCLWMNAGSKLSSILAMLVIC